MNPGGQDGTARIVSLSETTRHSSLTGFSGVVLFGRTISAPEKLETSRSSCPGNHRSNPCNFRSVASFECSARTSSTTASPSGVAR